MTIDWQQEVEKRKDDIIADLERMLRVKSVRDESQATVDAPLGPGPKAALDEFLKIAERDGFETMELDGMAGHIQYGEGDTDLGILAHVDVMPAGNGWDTDPFEPVIKDGNLYARGASDDKGPSMAAYYGMKIVKELGLPVNKKIRFILGTDEESSWRGMKHYFASMPQPDLGFSPDAFFPIINGEKGNVSFFLHFAGSNEGAWQLRSFEGGLRENMVPRDAQAEITTPDADQVKQAFADFVAANPIEGTVTENGDSLTLAVVGKAAHGQEPRNGENAATYLALFLSQFDFGGDAANYLNFTAKYIHDDSRMEHLGMAFTDEVMGDLTMNAGVFTFTAEKGGTITLNFRYPKGMDESDLQAGLAKATAAMGVKLEAGEGMVPHYVDPSDPIVQKLLAVYNRQTGSNAEGMVVGGGTYGRLLERGVAFGAMFPDTPDTMHQANEYIRLKDLFGATAIYAEAIYELVK